MTELLLLMAIAGYGVYKLHKKSERWMEALRSLLGAPPGDADQGARPTAEPARLAPERPRRALPLRKWLSVGLLYALALVGLLTVGRWVSRTVAARGYDAGGDLAAQEVARASSELAYAMLDHPVQRLFIPAWRVVDVRREPALCTDPLGPPELRDHAADVRLYTLFALPYRTVTVTCGGAVWGGRAPAR